MKAQPYYAFCDQCLHSEQNLLRAQMMTTVGLNAGLTHASTSSARNDTILYAHVHVEETESSHVNEALSLNYERVCGHRGYSYDAYQANLRDATNLSDRDAAVG